ncbi:MAG: S-layer homology domain-containing protein [Acidimicrobiales bacterium]
MAGRMCDNDTATPFSDVPDTSFAADGVRCLYNLGVTTGTTGTTYSPSDDVTREQMAAFLARMYKAMTGDDAPIVTHPFTDISPTSFAKDSIAQIYGLGITTGTSATTYSPNDLVTREQMAAFIARTYEAANDATAAIVDTPFTDVSATSFAKDAVAKIYGLEITTGTTPTTYSPGDNVTREQMAAFLARLYVAQ